MNNFGLNVALSLWNMSDLISLSLSLSLSHQFPPSAGAVCSEGDEGPPVLKFDSEVNFCENPKSPCQIFYSESSAGVEHSNWPRYRNVCGVIVIEFIAFHILNVPTEREAERPGGDVFLMTLKRATDVFWKQLPKERFISDNWYAQIFTFL